VPRYQCQQQVNIWAGILTDQLLGLIVLPNIRTGAGYRRFSEIDLPVPLEQRQHMCFMQDRTSPYFLPTVRYHLSHILGEEWVGRGGPVNRPAKSPNNPVEFCQRKQLKPSVYSALINDLEVLQQRVENALQEI
jgi:hypothetical protein